MLRPLRVSQLFDVTVNTTVRRFWALAALVLMAAIPVRAVEVAILAATVSDPDDITSRGAFSGTSDPTTGAVGVNLTVSLLGALVSVIATALCFKVAAAAYAGARADWRSSLSFALPRLAPVLWAAILAVLGILLGLAALILPGIWLLVSWSVFVPALLFEGLGPPRALGRSFALVRGRWWATLGALIVAVLIGGIASGIVSTGFDALMSTSLGDHVFLAALIDAVGGTVASAVGLPIQAVMVTVLYLDLRARKERLDVDMLARRLDVEPGTVAVPAAAASPAPAEPVPYGGEAPSGGMAPPGDEAASGWSPPAPPADVAPPSDWAPPRPPRPDAGEKDD
jgi:hypothetical protein